MSMNDELRDFWRESASTAQLETAIDQMSAQTRESRLEWIWMARFLYFRKNWWKENWKMENIFFSFSELLGNFLFAAEIVYFLKDFFFHKSVGKKSKIRENFENLLESKIRKQFCFNFFFYFFFGKMKILLKVVFQIHPFWDFLCFLLGWNHGFVNRTS